jgi:insertion element IS1 protein InsB
VCVPVPSASKSVAAELDERWSCVGAKKTERWLWHAIDHHTERVLAYVVGSRQDTTFLKLSALWVPFGITRYDTTDTAGVYRRYFSPAQHTVGKLSRQEIERKHLTLRTRLIVNLSWVRYGIRSGQTNAARHCP